MQYEKTFTTTNCHIYYNKMNTKMAEKNKLIKDLNKMIHILGKISTPDPRNMKKKKKNTKLKDSCI